MPARPRKVSGWAPAATPRRRDLGQAARDQRRFGVLAVAEAVRHAAGDGDDVLQRAADLDADQVVAGVDAERRRR